MTYNFCGIVIADIEEYRAFLAACEQYAPVDSRLYSHDSCTFSCGGMKVRAVCCGIGKVNAAAAAAYLVADGAECIFNVGLSGGMSGVARGQLSAPDRFYEHDFDLTPMGYEMGYKPNQDNTYYADTRLLERLCEMYPFIRVGAAVTGDCFVCDDRLRARLNGRYAPMTCDMETAAIASVCHDAGVPFLSVREVSDDAGDDACESYRDKNSEQSTAAPDVLLGLMASLTDR